MRKNTVKEKLRQGGAVVGVFCNLPSPSAAELLGLLGFDFVIVDGEHAPTGPETAEEMFRAIDTTGAIPLVRIAVNVRQNILRYLDAGALGVQIPMVNTAEEARAVVEATKYPPVGRRGLAAVRAAGWGIPMPLGEYVRRANEETLVVVQIETLQGASNADEIVAVDGVDVVFLGPTDISSSLGYHGQTTHPEVISSINRLGEKIMKAGKAAGTIAADLEGFRRWRGQGFQYLCTGLSAFIIKAGREYLNAFREVMGGGGR